MARERGVNPAVSVIVCAYTERRWTDTRDALASVAGQTVPAAEILLVVDHNPTLATRARAELTGVRVVESEGERGLSGARNTGVRHSVGEVVAFLDDDAVAAPDWLAQLLAPYGEADVVAVGGSARPQWPARAARPGWLSATGVLDWVVGCSYTGLPTGPADVRNLMGCSMSFRRSVFDAIGGFSSAVGRVGTSPLGCEETEFCIRARRALPGARIMFEPRAVVDHRVSPDRLTLSYVRRRGWSEGISKATVRRMAAARDLSTEFGYLTRVLPVALGSDLARAVTGRREGIAGAIGIVTAVLSTCAGYARQSARLSHERSNPQQDSATAVVELDAGQEPVALPARTPEGRCYRDVQVLVREGRWTLDLQRLPIADGRLGPQDLAPADRTSRPRRTSWAPRVTVVVPTADRADAVRRCVKSLLATNYPELEILIVDNRPRSAEAAALVDLANEDSRLRYLAEGVPGVSRARNTGLSAAAGELVAFVDDDIEVDRWWLANLVAELAEKRVDCATSLVLPNRLDTPAQQQFEKLKGFGQGARRQVFGPELTARDPLYPFAPGRFGPGGCALWRRATLLRLGGFDPLLGPGTATRAGEDLELFLRLARGGGTIVYTPHAVAWHEHGAEWGELRDRLHAYGLGLSAMFVRHLMRHPGDTRLVAAMVPKRLRGILAPTPPAQAADLASAGGRMTTRRLQLEQIAGLVGGPVALARSGWRARREQVR